MMHAVLFALLPILSAGSNYRHVKDVGEMLVQGGFDRMDKYEVFEMMGAANIAQVDIPDALMASILLAGELADDNSALSQRIRSYVQSSCQQILSKLPSVTDAGEELLQILQHARIATPDVSLMDLLATTPLAKFFSVCDIDIAVLSDSKSGARLSKMIIRSELQRSLGGMGLAVTERRDAIRVQLTSQRDRLLYEVMLYEPVELVSGATKFSGLELSRACDSVFRSIQGNDSFFYYDFLGNGSLKLIDSNRVMQRFNNDLNSAALVNALYVGIGRLLAMAVLFDVRITDPLDSSLIELLLNEPLASTKTHIQHAVTGFQQILPLSLLRGFSVDSKVLSNLLKGPPSGMIGPVGLHV